MLILAFCGGSASAQHQIIARDTNGLQDLRNSCAAAALLRSTGFTRRRDGILVDSHRQAVEFSILTNPSNVQRTKLATIVQDDLAQLAMQVHAVPLEFQAVMARIFDTYDYEAAVLGLVSGDADPNPEINVWTSGGATHLWP